MGTMDDFKEVMAELNSEAIFYDSLDGAVLGYSERCGLEPVVVYDRLKALEIIMEKENLSYDEALEHFEFNIIGGYLGEGTPVFYTPIAEAIEGF